MRTVGVIAITLVVLVIVYLMYRNFVASKTEAPVIKMKDVVEPTPPVLTTNTIVDRVVRPVYVVNSNSLLCNDFGYLANLTSLVNNYNTAKTNWQVAVAANIATPSPANQAAEDSALAAKLSAYNTYQSQRSKCGALPASYNVTV